MSLYSVMSSFAWTGAEEATAAWISSGYLRRDQPASIPGYEPPNETHLFAVPRPHSLFVAVAYAWNAARSASAYVVVGEGEDGEHGAAVGTRERSGGGAQSGACILDSGNGEVKPLKFIFTQEVGTTGKLTSKAESTLKSYSKEDTMVRG